MATSSRRLSLTRDQLALFLQDHEQIRQFERLFATVDAIAPDFVNEVSTAAGNAQAAAAEAIGLLTEIAQETATNVAAAEAKAAQALGALQALQQQVDLLATAPPSPPFFSRHPPRPSHLRLLSASPRCCSIRLFSLPRFLYLFCLVRLGIF